MLKKKKPLPILQIFLITEKQCVDYRASALITSVSLPNFRRRFENSEIRLIRFLHMEEQNTNLPTQLVENLFSFLRGFVCSVLSVGPIPNHVAFIMDGNRRFAKRNNLEEGSGHESGFSGLTRMLKYCYELGIQHVTIYAFSIDNFKRRPQEVQSTMRLIKEKIEGLIEKESVVNRHGVRVHFVGNLKLLPEPVRSAAERATRATAQNARAVLSICIAYTSTDEIVRAVEECCVEKWDDGGEGTCLIGVADVDRQVRMGGASAPDPDVIVRTSGETRLSNFLLWQSTCALLYSPGVLWPEIGFRHLVRAVLDFQRSYTYLEKNRKQS